MSQAEKISTDGQRQLNKSFNVLFLWVGLFLEPASVNGSQTGKKCSLSWELNYLGLGLRLWCTTARISLRKPKLCFTVSKGQEGSTEISKLCIGYTRVYLTIYTLNGENRYLLVMIQVCKLDGYMQVVYILLRDLFWVMGACGVALKVKQILVNTNQMTLVQYLDFLSAEQSVLFPKQLKHSQLNQFPVK